MLSHVLIMMQRVQRKGMGDRQRDYMHASQRDRIQKVVTEFCDVHPECRVVPNTKSAWDDVLVDAAMQMLLVWCVYGHCCLNNPAWPAFARMCMVMLSYQGSREIFFVFANLVVVAFDPSVTTTESLKSLHPSRTLQYDPGSRLLPSVLLSEGERLTHFITTLVTENNESKRSWCT